MAETPRILIAGGGTGGHLFPALAIGAELEVQNPASQIHYVGSIQGLEARLWPQRGVAFSLVAIRGLQRGFRPATLGRNLLLPGRIVTSLVKIRRLFHRFQPQVVVGTGGYASALPVWFATREGIPTLIQEQNSYPGLTTRWLAGRVDRVCLAFEEAQKWLKKKTALSPGIRSGRELSRVTG